MAHKHRFYLITLTVYFFVSFVAFWVKAEDTTAAKFSAAGTWRGNIRMGDADIVVDLHISENPDHSYTARMDVPNAGRKDVTIDEFNCTGDDIKLSIKNLVDFSGKLNQQKDSFSGKWTQLGNEFAATFRKSTGAATESTVRPQDPKRPFPYREEEVIVEQKGNGIRLGGTLCLPALTDTKTKAPYPAVLLITGSGPQDRDETVAGHRPFPIIADFLVRRGIAVLRVDDRGIGKSTGDFERADTSDFAEDAMASIEFLRSRKDIDPKRIGIIGHSEGATIASIMASRDPEIAFIVMLAGPGLSGEELTYSQSAAMLRADGAREEQIASNRKLQEQVIAVLKQEKDLTVAEQKLHEVFQAGYRSLTDAQQKAIGDMSPRIDKEIKRLLSPASRFGIAYDPAATLKQVHCPVLALDGDKDTIVVATENLPRIEAALKLGGNSRCRVQTLAGLNHLFQTCKTGAMNEYDKIDETFSPAALEIIGDWATAQLGDKVGK
jgi:pimeloyl-ACP methyl ester carboxylesterase